MTSEKKTGSWSTLKKTGYGLDLITFICNFFLIVKEVHTFETFTITLLWFWSINNTLLLINIESPILRYFWRSDQILSYRKSLSWAFGFEEYQFIQRFLEKLPYLSKLAYILYRTMWVRINCIYAFTIYSEIQNAE